LKLVGRQGAALRKLETSGCTNNGLGVILPSRVDQPKSPRVAETVLLKKFRPPNAVELSDCV
jgi:hypothetical protein